MTTSEEERLTRLEQRVQDLYAFKNRIEARAAADDATVMNFLTEMEERTERQFDDIREKLHLVYELLLGRLPPQNQQ